MSHIETLIKSMLSSVFPWSYQLFAKFTSWLSQFYCHYYSELHFLHTLLLLCLFHDNQFLFYLMKSWTYLGINFLILEIQPSIYLVSYPFHNLSMISTSFYICESETRGASVRDSLLELEFFYSPFYSISLMGIIQLLETSQQTNYFLHNSVYLFSFQKKGFIRKEL